MQITRKFNFRRSFMKYVDVAKIIESPSALTQEQGDLVFREIDNAFKQHDKISIDFENVESIISPFLNNAIGKLYEKYSSDYIKENLKMVNFPAEKNSTMNVVITNAKRFYTNKQKFSQTVKEVIDNE